MPRREKRDRAGIPRPDVQRVGIRVEWSGCMLAMTRVAEIAECRTADGFNVFDARPAIALVVRVSAFS